ncbi:hypothetical protein DDF83_04325 [Mycobacterium tuberculosis]|nr:hypothetical protein DDF83_04325 [Mycobacterium tuberculosis]
MCPPTGPTSTLPQVKEATTMVVVGTDAHKYSHTFVPSSEHTQPAAACHRSYCSRSCLSG